MVILKYGYNYASIADNQVNHWQINILITSHLLGVSCSFTLYLHSMNNRQRLVIFSDSERATAFTSRLVAHLLCLEQSVHIIPEPVHMYFDRPAGDLLWSTLILT